ncbi:MAG: hypothetical protein M3042_12225 [Actinomycetota bacterium]|nr:hypothetical protein [Actinomycetota bacterium]
MPAPTGGVAGNQRLTATVAAVLLVLLAIEGITIAFIRPLLTVHVFVGVLLIGPVALKVGSTTYRFARYYLRAEPYRRRGPPPLAFRILGPLLILSSLTVLGSGVGLVATRSGRDFFLQLHKASFVLWFVLMSAHVVGYARRLVIQLAADWRRHVRAAGWVGGRGWRVALVAGSVLVGLVAALASRRWGTAWPTGGR